MKYKLLAVSKYAERTKEIGVNIGDYIQALASSQFYPHIDGFIDRDEELKEYDDEECNVIMNGWYMHNTENWPPSEKINPLFVAFHINSVARNKLLSPESIDYLKKHQPIGCRDKKTVELLSKKGVDAYFSGCMTLTLGQKYISDEKENTTYMVDPIYDCHFNLSNIFEGIRTILIHGADIYRIIFKKNLDLQGGRNWFKRLIKTALYYKEYTRVFGKSVVMDSVYVYQDSDIYLSQFENDFDRLKEAERLVINYSRAKLVITSRIHCALPCLGIETPVIYIDRAKDTETSACRLDGLKELFNCVSLDKGRLYTCFQTSLPITIQNHPTNRRLYQQYANRLIAKCQSFVSSVER